MAGRLIAESQSHRTDQGSSKGSGKDTRVVQVQKSQSHRTDQGSSKITSFLARLDRDLAVGSQSHRTDQGSSKRDIRKEIVMAPRSRNPTVQIREVPRGIVNSMFPSWCLQKVAIPPYRSGKFQGLKRRTSSALTTESSRNPTVQIREVPRSSTAAVRWARARSRNPTVQIREVPRYASLGHDYTNMKKSQSHRTDQGSSKHV